MVGVVSTLLTSGTVTPGGLLSSLIDALVLSYADGALPVYTRDTDYEVLQGIKTVSKYTQQLSDAQNEIEPVPSHVWDRLYSVLSATVLRNAEDEQSATVYDEPQLGLVKARVIAIDGLYRLASAIGVHTKTKYIEQCLTSMRSIEAVPSGLDELSIVYTVECILRNLPAMNDRSARLPIHEEFVMHVPRWCVRCLNSTSRSLKSFVAHRIIPMYMASNHIDDRMKLDLKASIWASIKDLECIEIAVESIGTFMKILVPEDGRIETEVDARLDVKFWEILKSGLKSSSGVVFKQSIVILKRTLRSCQVDTNTDISQINENTNVG
eukprot:CFRG6781T1